MAYTLFEKGHTVSAVDFDSNYKHVGQGDLLPRGNTLLEETTGVYDLGSNAYRWNNIHIQNLELQSGGEVQHCMNLIAETILSATASSIEFTGLNGETDEIYEVICNIIGYATETVSLYFNGDSTTNNYGYQYIQIYSITSIAARGTSYTGIWIGRTGLQTITALYSRSINYIYANNSIKFVLNKVEESIGDTFITSNFLWGQVWNNSDTLTSMKFTGSFDPGTNIQIWSKR